MLRTFGMPTRICERSLGADATEGFFANQVGNIRKFIFVLFHSGFYGAHFVGVFHKALGAGVVDDDALPTLRERDFAPLAALAAGELDVNEAALAIHRAPVTDGLARGDGLVRE